MMLRCFPSGCRILIFASLFDLYGLEQLVGAIKLKAQELGAKLHIQSPLDQDKSIQEQIVLVQWKQDRWLKRQETCERAQS